MKNTISFYDRSQNHPLTLTKLNCNLSNKTQKYIVHAKITEKLEIYYLSKNQLFNK